MRHSVLRKNWQNRPSDKIFSWKDIYEPEVSSHQTPNLLAFWSWTFQPPEQWGTNICLKYPVYSFVCYSSPNGISNDLIRTWVRPTCWYWASTMEAGLAVAHCWDRHWSSSFGEKSLVWALLGSTILSPRRGLLQQPVGANAGMPQASQPTGQEYSCTYQHTGGVKSSWVHSRPLNTPPEMALPTRDTRPRSTTSGQGLVPPPRKPAQAS